MRHASLALLTLILTASFAQAQEVAQRKSGLWEVTRTSMRTGGKPRLIQMCIDRASDDALQQLAEGMRNERCKVDNVRHEGDKIIVDAVCALGYTATSATTHAVITGNFDSAYKIESKSKYEPPVPKAEGTTVLDAKWTGPCKPGQRPGDVILQDGQKVNDADMSEEKRALREAGHAQGPAKAKQ